MGTTPPPPRTLCEGSPPIIGGINEVKLGAACGYHTAPSSVLQKKEKPPSIGGLNEMKSGQCDGYHTAPLLLIKNPPQTIEGDRNARMERCVGCTPLIRIGKAKADGVWDAHCLVWVWKVKCNTFYSPTDSAGIDLNYNN